MPHRLSNRATFKLSMPSSKRSISAKNWHAKKSSEASLKSQVASAFQLVKKTTLEPLASWLLVRRLRLCSCVVRPRLLVLTQTAPQALCLTITRRQRHHGQSISRWSLYYFKKKEKDGASTKLEDSEPDSGSRLLPVKGAAASSTST